MKRFLLCALLPLALSAQVTAVPDTTFPAFRSLMNANFAWLQNNKMTAPATYASGTAYNQADVVVYSGAWYVSLLGANAGNTPSTSPTWWMAFPSGGSGAIVSVFGRTGAVVAATNDYSYAQLSGNPYSLFSGVSPISYNASTGAFSCSTCLTSNAVASVFGRTGAVVAAANDYSFAQLSGSLAIGQIGATGAASSSTYLRGDYTWATAESARFLDARARWLRRPTITAFRNSPGLLTRCFRARRQLRSMRPLARSDARAA
jgi:hypothetical protein